MVMSARAWLGDRYRYAVADAAALPHPRGDFHAAIANHVLYHVPDRARAVRELARVLRPDGVLYAVTNGRDHVREIDDLIKRWAAPGALVDHSAEFGLENGAQQLRAGFAGTELRRWEDALEITEAEPLIAYVRSMSAGSVVDMEGVRREATRAIDCQGVIRVRKSTGLFIARGPIQSR
jgi:SAM-dependent methyltransferase